MSTTAIALLEALDRFFNECPRAIASVVPEIPTAAELELIESLENLPELDASDVVFVRSSFSMGRLENAYLLIGFAKRMAVQTVRTLSARFLRAGAIGLIIDDIADYRDVLRALSILEESSIRLGISFETIMRTFVPLAGDRRRQTLEGYMSRSPEMRRPSVMGLTVTGDGPTFNYQSKS